MTTNHDDPVRVCIVPATDPIAIMLAVAQQDELGAHFGFRGFPLANPEAFTSPLGAFVVAYDREVPVACGGICPEITTPGTAELKRMYTLPSYRRRGIARRVLRALEGEAYRLGYRRLCLETGDTMVWALTMYHGEGYTRIPPYPPYLTTTYSVCFEKHLAFDQ